VRFNRLLFLAVLFVMSASSIVVFASSTMEWMKYRVLSNEAHIFLLPEPSVNGPDDELAYQKRLQENGPPVRVVQMTGREFQSSVKLTHDQFASARSSARLKARFIQSDNGKTELRDSPSTPPFPFGWLALSVTLSALALFARKLWAHESGQYG
jgi:hypothetical protein